MNRVQLFSAGRKDVSVVLLRAHIVLQNRVADFENVLTLTFKVIFMTQASDVWPISLWEAPIFFE